MESKKRATRFFLREGGSDPPPMKIAPTRLQSETTLEANDYCWKAITKVEA
jgi:hypothetical protein